MTVSTDLDHSSASTGIADGSAIKTRREKPRYLDFRDMCGGLCMCTGKYSRINVFSRFGGLDISDSGFSNRTWFAVICHVLQKCKSVFDMSNYLLIFNEE